MKKMFVVVILLGLVLILGLFVSNKVATQKREALARAEAEKKARMTLWENSVILMSKDDLFSAYPKLISAKSYSEGRNITYYELPEPKQIGGNPYYIKFKLNNDQLTNVFLTLDEKAANSYMFADKAYELYRALVLMYGRGDNSYTLSDFERRKFIQCTWSHKFTKIYLYYATLPGYPNEMYLNYYVNFDLLRSLSMTQGL